tara:strand:+ start:383 stop:562 length:180 start_codon:yes stop_codon:yes gene_type:complete
MAIALIEMTIDYNTPAEEFDALGDKYPTGEYREDTGTYWFRVTITGDSTNGVKLTWFKE